MKTATLLVSMLPNMLRSTFHLILAAFLIGTAHAQNVGPQQGASQKFSALFFDLKNFAFIILAIGGIIAGLMFIIGKKEFIVGVIMGTIIIASILFVMGLLATPFD
jgi:hypothetical protein